MTAMMRVPRTRGAGSGLLLILLGAWGALIPFVGPYFHFAYTPDTAWTWTWGRFFLEIVPGVAVALGGLILIISAFRPVAMFGAALAAAGGAWFAVGSLLGPGRARQGGPPFRRTGSGRGHVLVTEIVEQAHLVAEVRARRARRGDERALPRRHLVLAGERGADVHGHHERAAVLAGAGAAMGGDAHGERVEAVPVLVLGRLVAPLGDVGGAEAGDVLA